MGYPVLAIFPLMEQFLTVLVMLIVIITVVVVINQIMDRLHVCAIVLAISMNVLAILRVMANHLAVVIMLAMVILLVPVIQLAMSIKHSANATIHCILFLLISFNWRNYGTNNQSNAESYQKV